MTIRIVKSIFLAGMALYMVYVFVRRKFMQPKLKKRK